MIRLVPIRPRLIILISQSNCTICYHQGCFYSPINLCLLRPTLAFVLMLVPLLVGRHLGVSTVLGVLDLASCLLCTCRTVSNTRFLAFFWCPQTALEWKITFLISSTRGMGKLYQSALACQMRTKSEERARTKCHTNHLLFLNVESITIHLLKGFLTSTITRALRKPTTGSIGTTLASLSICHAMGRPMYHFLCCRED